MTWSTLPAIVAGQPVPKVAWLDVVTADTNALGSHTVDGRAAASIWNGTLGAGGAIDSRYRAIGAPGSAGGTVDWNVEITLGTGFAIGTGLTLPVTAASSISPTSANCHAFDTSANAWWPVWVSPAGNVTGITLRTLPASAGSNLVVLSATVPFAFAAGDIIVVRHSYRMA